MKTMKINSYLFIAKKFIFGKNSSALKTGVLAVTISLLPLLISLNIIKSMQNQMLNQSLEVYSYHVQLRSLLPISSDSYLDIKKRLLKDPFITKIALEMRSGAMVFNALGRTGITIRALEDSSLIDDKTLSANLNIEPTILKNNEAIIGDGLATKHRLKIGDELRLLSVKKTGSSFMPTINRFTIVNIFKTGFVESDLNWVFISQNNLVNIIDSKQIDMFLGLKTTMPYNKNFENTMVSIVSKLPSSNNWLTTYWQTANQFFIENMKTSKILLIIVLGLIILVSCININSALQIFYIQNQESIAMLGVLGLKNKDNFFILFTTSVLMGALGLLFGIIISVFLTINLKSLIEFIEFLSRIIYNESIFDFYVSSFSPKIDLVGYLIMSILVILMIVVSSLISLKLLQKAPIVQVLNRTL